ncbi:hypothetical protein JCM8547_006323 [Rhodosporidiobolus lusitaniae]
MTAPRDTGGGGGRSFPPPPSHQDDRYSRYAPSSLPPSHRQSQGYDPRHSASAFPPDRDRDRAGGGGCDPRDAALSRADDRYATGGGGGGGERRYAAPSSFPPSARHHDDRDRDRDRDRERERDRRSPPASSKPSTSASSSSAAAKIDPKVSSSSSRSEHREKDRPSAPGFRAPLPSRGAEEPPSRTSSGGGGGERQRLDPWGRPLQEPNWSGYGPGGGYGPRGGEARGFGGRGGGGYGPSAGYTSSDRNSYPRPSNAPGYAPSSKPYSPAPGSSSRSVAVADSSSRRRSPEASRTGGGSTASSSRRRSPSPARSSRSSHHHHHHHHHHSHSHSISAAAPSTSSATQQQQQPQKRGRSPSRSPPSPGSSLSPPPRTSKARRRRGSSCSSEFSSRSRSRSPDPKKAQERRKLSGVGKDGRMHRPRSVSRSPPSSLDSEGGYGSSPKRGREEKAKEREREKDKYAPSTTAGQGGGRSGVKRGRSPAPAFPASGGGAGRDKKPKVASTASTSSSSNANAIQLGASSRYPLSTSTSSSSFPAARPITGPPVAQNGLDRPFYPASGPLSSLPSSSSSSSLLAHPPSGPSTPQPFNAPTGPRALRGLATSTASSVVPPPTSSIVPVPPHHQHPNALPPVGTGRVLIDAPKGPKATRPGFVPIGGSATVVKPSPLAAVPTGPGGKGAGGKEASGGKDVRKFFPGDEEEDAGLGGKEEGREKQTGREREVEREERERENRGGGRSRSRERDRSGRRRDSRERDRIEMDEWEERYRRRDVRDGRDSRRRSRSPPSRRGDDRDRRGGDERDRDRRDDRDRDRRSNDRNGWPSRSAPDVPPPRRPAVDDDPAGGSKTATPVRPWGRQPPSGPATPSNGFGGTPPTGPRQHPSSSSANAVAPVNERRWGSGAAGVASSASNGGAGGHEPSPYAGILGRQMSSTPAGSGPPTPQSQPMDLDSQDSTSTRPPPPHLLVQQPSDTPPVRPFPTGPAALQQQQPPASSTSAPPPGQQQPSVPVPAPAAPTELYERLVQVGEGTYGKVYKARNVETGGLVALKRIRMEAEKDGFPVTAVREIKLLQGLRHSNVVELVEMLVSKGHVYMVFEYVDHDLTGVLNHPTINFTPAHLKSLMQQFLQGLGFIHRRGVLHRDLKGSNILLSRQGELKIADFGLARFFQRGRGNDYTNRVITQWYKPPELLFGATVYGEAVDMWSAGCIFLELFARRPVFQGQDEIHQLEVIFKITGTPSVETWPGLHDLPWYELVKPKEALPSRLREAFSKWLTPAGLNVAERLLSLDPAGRPLCEEALAMPYFVSEEPAPELPTMLADVKGEWHEYESKQYLAPQIEAKTECKFLATPSWVPAKRRFPRFAPPSSSPSSPLVPSFGAFIAADVVDSLGRCLTIIAGCAIYMAGVVIQMFAASALATIVVNRIVAGLGVDTVDCSTVPSLPAATFYFGGKPYKLDASDYILEVQGTCMSAFMGLDIPAPAVPIWIGVNVFLRKLYTVYDLGKNADGFAKSK